VKTSPGKTSLPGCPRRTAPTLARAGRLPVTVRFMHWLAIGTTYTAPNGARHCALQIVKLKLPRPVSTEANPDVQATFKNPDLIEVMSTTSVMNCPFAISVKMKAAWDLKLFVVESLHSLGLSYRSRAMVARQLLALWCS